MYTFKIAFAVAAIGAASSASALNVAPEYVAFVFPLSK